MEFFVHATEHDVHMYAKFRDLAFYDCAASSEVTHRAEGRQ
jgi:hypothetical protein